MHVNCMCITKVGMYCYACKLHVYNKGGYAIVMRCKLHVYKKGGYVLLCM